MTLTDADVGITKFLGKHAPFRGVVKQQLSDFVVNEVCRGGDVVRLTSTKVPDDVASLSSNPPATTLASCVKEGDDAENAELPTTPETTKQWDAACAVLDDKLSSGSFGDGNSPSRISASIRGYVTGSDETLVLPPLSNKADRTAIHEWVKLYLPALISDTVEADEGTRAIRLRKREACRPWKRRKTESRRDGSSGGNPDAALDNTYDPREHAGGREGRSRSRGGAKRREANAFVQFVLWKQDKDTMGALTDIARRLRINVDALSHAGTKDKRAITSQRVRVRGVPSHRLASLNKSFQNMRGSQRIVLGNFTVLAGADNRQLSLGDLAGNRFTLALRGLDIHDDDGEKNILDAVASVRDRGFINYFGLQRFGSGASSTHETGYAVLRGDFEEACRLVLLPAIIPGIEAGEKELRDERRRSNAALNGFATGKTTARELYRDLPPWMNVERSLAMAYMKGEERGMTNRDHKTAFSTLPRNLRKMYGHAVQSFLWNLMASSRMRQSQALFAIEGDIIPKEGKRVTNLSSRTDVRTVTAQEAADCSVTHILVLIPVPGSQVAVPDTETGAEAREVLAREKVDLLCAPAEYDMTGTYRWLVARPEDVDARIVSYSDPRERLVPCDTARALLGSLPVGKHTGAKQEVDVEEARTRSHFDNAERKITENGRAGNAEPVHPVMRALVVSFTLGCGEYATMLMRELTKQESSVANQKAQQELASL
jgi:tRNA pseudouridine13 synthase